MMLECFTLAEINVKFQQNLRNNLKTGFRRICKIVALVDDLHLPQAK